MSDAEVKRIQEVYADYERSEAWDFWRDRYHPVNPYALLLDRPWDLQVASLLRRKHAHRLKEVTVLDVGCGHGARLLRFLQLGLAPENLTGLDVYDPALEGARRLHPAIHWVKGDGRSLPFPDASFDIVHQFTVFTSILDADLKRSLAAEMLRVLKPGGTVLWCDNRSDMLLGNLATAIGLAWKNPRTRWIGRREIETLFPGCRRRFTRVCLAAPIAERLARVSLLLCECLELLPFLRTNWWAEIEKAG